MSSYKRNRIRKPLTTDKVQLRLSQAICEAEKVLLTTDNENTKLQAVYAMSNAVNSYMKHFHSTYSREYDLDSLSDKQLKRIADGEPASKVFSENGIEQ